MRCLQIDGGALFIFSVAFHDFRVPWSHLC